MNFFTVSLGHFPSTRRSDPGIVVLLAEVTPLACTDRGADAVRRPPGRWALLARPGNSPKQVAVHFVGFAVIPFVSGPLWEVMVPPPPSGF